MLKGLIRDGIVSVFIWDSFNKVFEFVIEEVFRECWLLLLWDYNVIVGILRIGFRW